MNLLDKQQFSEKTLKGFLLKNLDPNTQNPLVQQLNTFLVQRVDNFWDAVVVPLRKKNHFDGNKINWYFEIYKEGLEARKVVKNPFTFIQITREQILEIVKSFDGKSLSEYLEYGTSYLSNTYTVLSSWVRDMMIVQRLEHIYKSDDPVEWILAAEAEENGLMKKQTPDIPGLMDLVNNIGFIMSRRV